MPIYEYFCSTCSGISELLTQDRSLDEVECSHCSAPARKIISSGSGRYRFADYKEDKGHVRKTQKWV